MRCKVTRLKTPPKGTADWNAAPWKKIQPQLIQDYMGTRPDHFPKTEFKIAYDSKAVYVIFRVEDQYVRAVAEGNQYPVCRDSCVEFFFTPDTDLGKGYFNLEMNCGGIMLFHYQPLNNKPVVTVAPEDYDRISITHSLPERVEPEIKQPVTWTVEYAIPLDVLRKYCPISEPARGTIWRANFYKCGDQTSHPHWLTWAHVDFPKPKFHLPEFFGEIEFE